MKSCNVTIQMKATEQYFPVALFIMLYKVVLTVEFVNEIQIKAFEQYFPVVLFARWFLLLTLWYKPP